MAERLRNVADNLSRVYAAAPLENVEDLRALIQQLRASSRLTNVRQLCAGVSPNGEGERLIICPECGQMLDCGDQAQVEHHSSDKHAPKFGIRPS